MAGSVPHYDHIVVVVEENHTPDEITSQSPYIDSLISKGASLTDYSALGHPSQPNYLGLYAGSTYGVTDDGNYSLSGPTLATALAAAGKSFTGYVDSGGSQDHNPWESFGNNVEAPMSSFPQGHFANLPSVSFVVPNPDHDMHDGSVQQGDAWLQQNLGSYADWAAKNNSLLVVTTDEDDGSGDNKVMTVLDGAHVVPGTYSTPADHYSLLSTIAAAEGVTAPGNGATTKPLTGMFDTSTGTPTPTPTPAPPPSSGDVLDLSLSEDAWKGDAQFTLSVDSKQVGGTMTAHALASSGASQHIKLTGNWGMGAHSVAITFLNDAYGGTASTDRNLYVNSIAYDGAKYANTTAILYSAATQSFQVGGTSKTAPSDTNALTLHLSEDAYRGDAQVQISVDGKAITTPDVVKALHSAGALQDFMFTGLGTGSHDIGVTFPNDAYAGTPSTDRNLYVNSIDYGSHHFATNAALMSTGTQHFTVS